MPVTEDTRSTIYVTARFPYGATEPFLVPEIRELGRRRCDVTIVPTRPDGGVAHGDAAGLLERTVAAPLLSRGILRSAAAETARGPGAVAAALGDVLRSRSPRILAKNLAVFPKGLWLGRHARERGVEHLHAHWASTPATLAMVAGRVSGIPWSLTAHRWDIAEDNLLGLKARRACFVRVISEHGAEELRGIVGRSDWSPWVLHMGVPLPVATDAEAPPEPPLRVLTAARLVEKKGHADLLAAVGLLKERGVPVRVDLAGGGPLGPSLAKQVASLGLEEDVVFRGNVPHEELVRGMAAREWHAAVLSSVVSGDGELEGIPVSLVEAMACGLPAVGTDAGGTPELLRDGAGIVVPQGDATALAAAIERLAGDPALRDELGARGRERVREAFAADEVAAALLARFRDCDRRG
jgi:glycosyltransferase involved in cell wall biosynthesis